MNRLLLLSYLETIQARDISYQGKHLLPGGGTSSQEEASPYQGKHLLPGGGASTRRTYLLPGGGASTRRRYPHSSRGKEPWPLQGLRYLYSESCNSKG
jgi:hypothetical protein